MSEYQLHPEAFADLDDIREYIADDDPDASDRLIAEIFDRIRTGGISPSGIQPPEYYIPSPLIRAGA
jgi:plasmid stabilization system protein ParE